MFLHLIRAWGGCIITFLDAFEIKDTKCQDVYILGHSNPIIRFLLKKKFKKKEGKSFICVKILISALCLILDKELI